MKFTLEEKEECFTPKVLTLVIETPEEIKELAKALDSLPHNDSFDDLVSAVQEEADKWEEDD